MVEVTYLKLRRLLCGKRMSTPCTLRYKSMNSIYSTMRRLSRLISSMSIPHSVAVFAWLCKGASIVRCLIQLYTPRGCRLGLSSVKAGCRKRDSWRSWCLSCMVMRVKSLYSSDCTESWRYFDARESWNRSRLESFAVSIVIFPDHLYWGVPFLLC